MIRTTQTVLAFAALLSIGCASTPAPAPAASATATPTSGATATASTATPATPATTAPDAFQRVSIDELSGMIDRHEAVAVFDNNARERYERGHVPGARWVAYDQVTPAVLPADRSAHLVFYCGNEQCHACHTAAQAAISLGYQNVAILPAGIMGWTAANKPVVAGPNPT